MTESTSWETEAIQEQINKQSQFCNWQLFSENQNDSLRDKIGFILHRRGIESNIHNPNFSPEERDQIEIVFQKIRKRIPPPNEINFGCTFVTVYKKRTREQEIILFRCTLPNSRTIFIEPSGREYASWNDFIKSNKIQNGCEYFAPSDGVYTADGQIRKFKKENSGYFNVAIAVAVLCIVATVETPVISTAFSVVMYLSYLYGAYRSLSTILDRYKHKESSHNVETVFGYLTLLTICLTQLCIAVVGHKEYFFKEFGIHWCKLVISTLNGTILCLDAISFVICISIFYSKVKADRITTSDVFNLLLQAFLLYEQAINTIEFLELLSDTSYFRSFQKMTKSQKRNWKRRKSKDNRRTMESKNNKIFEYQNDFFRFIKWFSKQIVSRSGEFLMKNLVQSVMTFTMAIVAGLLANAWRN